MLCDDVLFYFKELPQFEPIATVNLDQDSRVVISGTRELQLHTAHRIYRLRAEDEGTSKAWCDALQLRQEALTGFLEKRGQHNVLYRRRWFCFDPDDNVLSYFKDPPEFAPIGAIELRSLRSRPSLMVESSRQQRAHCFQIETPRRVYVLSATCAQEAQHWVDQLGLCVDKMLPLVKSLGFSGQSDWDSSMVEQASVSDGACTDGDNYDVAQKLPLDQIDMERFRQIVLRQTVSQKTACSSTDDSL